VSTEVVEGRSYCAAVAPDRMEMNRASPSLVVFRGYPSTVLAMASGSDMGACFVAPATETVLFKAKQSDTSARTYRVTVLETTLWANWFYNGASYASYTLLRNTSTNTIRGRITWRDDTGGNRAFLPITLPPGGIAFRVPNFTGILLGSVEVAHDGPPQGLVGSQTTLSPVTGLSFDTLLMSRKPR